MVEATNYRGTADWRGQDARIRRVVTDIFSSTLETYGFEPLETPIIEYASVLDGKGGDESNTSIYRFQRGSDKLGLRFDQTVPLARVATQYTNELSLPYKRYAIGPVFRADKPQKGRFRQFTQMDFDTLGCSNIIADAEILTILTDVGQKFRFPDFVVRFSDRSLLTGMAQVVGAKTEDQALTAIRGWDKISKVGRKQVTSEVRQVGLNPNTFNDLTDRLTDLSGSNRQVLNQLRRILPQGNTNIDTGISRLESLVSATEYSQIPEGLCTIDPLLARGLDYYTGPIFEVEASRQIGSVAGGGRFDNLIEALGGPSIPATGASFGLERVVTIMTDLQVLPRNTGGIDVYVTVFNDQLLPKSLQIASQLRKQGINVELDMSGDKLGKQFKLADTRQARLAIVIGPDEAKSSQVSVKNLDIARGGTKSNQFSVDESDLVDQVRKLLT